MKRERSGDGEREIKVSFRSPLFDFSVLATPLVSISGSNAGSEVVFKER